MVATTSAHLEGCAVNETKEGNCPPSLKPLRLPPPLSSGPRNKRTPGRQQPHSADKQGAGVGRQLLQRKQERISAGQAEETNRGLVWGASLCLASSRQAGSTPLQMASSAQRGSTVSAYPAMLGPDIRSI